MIAPHRLSVLVVDNHPDAADTLADRLRLHAYRVVVARTACEAVAAAGCDPPDVALLDIRLPNSDGWQVARWLQENVRDKGRVRRPFLIAVTGSGTDGDRWRSVDVEIDLHLVKPVDPGS
jgi:CheY-like chemotaxis protein